MRSAKELSGIIGRRGSLETKEGLRVAVRVVDVRERFGSLDYRVEPIRGDGSAWVMAERVTGQNGVGVPDLGRLPNRSDAGRRAAIAADRLHRSTERLTAASADLSATVERSRVRRGLAGLALVLALAGFGAPAESSAEPRAPRDCHHATEGCE